MNLYLVKCRGMQFSSLTAPHGVAYVIADSPDEAYQTLRRHLDAKNYGFEKERQLATIELVAEAKDYSDAPYRLLFAAGQEGERER